MTTHRAVPQHRLYRRILAALAFVFNLKGGGRPNRSTAGGNGTGYESKLVSPLAGVAESEAGGRVSA